MALAASVALAFAASPGFAQSYFVPPDWILQPDGEDIAHAYPLIASTLRIEGLATLTCGISEVGLLEACRATDSPQGLGFGRGALSLTPQFRMATALEDGRPVAHDTVRIPIRFVLPPLPTRTTVGMNQEPSEAALAAAKAAAFMHTQTLERLAKDLELEKKEPVEAETYATAARELRAAAAVTEALWVRETAGTFDQFFSAAELAALAAFYGTPAGKAEDLSAARIESAARVVSGSLFAELRRVGFQAACRELACESPDQAKVEESSRAFRAAVAEGVGIQGWIQWPDRFQLYHRMPELARLLGIPGGAILSCQTTLAGLTAGCDVVLEAPSGLGFGEAAKEAAKLYRLAPPPNDRGLTGARAFVPVFFFLFPRPDWRDPKPADPEALNLARKYVALVHFRANLLEGVERFVAELEEAGAGLDPQLSKAVASAVAAESANAATIATERMARLYALILTKEELAGMNAFRETAAGQRALEVDQDVRFQEAFARHSAPHRAIDIARENFCAKYACVIGPSTPEPAPQAVPTP